MNCTNEVAPAAERKRSVRESTTCSLRDSPWKYRSAPAMNPQAGSCALSWGEPDSRARKLTLSGLTLLGRYLTAWAGSVSGGARRMSDDATVPATELDVALLPQPMSVAASSSATSAAAGNRVHIGSERRRLRRRRRDAALGVAAKHIREDHDHQRHRDHDRSDRDHLGQQRRRARGPVEEHGIGGRPGRSEERCDRELVEADRERDQEARHERWCEQRERNQPERLQIRGAEVLRCPHYGRVK